MKRKSLERAALITSLVLMILGLAGYIVLLNTVGTSEPFSQLLNRPPVSAAQDKRNLTLTVYLKKGIATSSMLALKNLLESQSSIQSVQFISAEQALVAFKAKQKDNQAVLQSLDSLTDNPLDASLTATITDPSQKESTVNFIKSHDPDSIVDAIN